MTAKQSAVLVARAKKRRTLRDELRARCGVFNETDHGTSENAPEGWVEIQRFDSIDREFGDRKVEPFGCDEHAALAVAQIGGSIGTAMRYETASGLIVPLDLDGLPETDERWKTVRYMAAAAGEHAEHWICIVPRSVAIAAGLDCEAAE